MKKKTGMTRDEAVLSVWPYIQSFAKKWAKNGDTFLDLCQEGAEGAIHAFDNFDETRGVKYFTYASYYIHARIRDYCIKDKPVKISVKKEKEAIKKRKENPNYTKTEYTTQPFNERYIGKISEQLLEKQVAYQKILYAAERLLTTTERTIVKMRLEGNTFSEILTQFKDASFTTRQRIQQIETIALNKLRKHFEVEIN